MKVLVACEVSGIVREAFRALGHEAWSCDLQDSPESSPWHITGDCLAVLDAGWDLMVAHPECRFLCNSGALRLYRDGKKANGKDDERWKNMEVAARFFVALMKAPIPRIAIENSVMHGYAKALIAPHVVGWQKQIIQPHQFGEDASKATLLLLKNLPPLMRTGDVPPRWVGGKPRWSNQTNSGQNRLAPSPMRSSIRAKTYRGPADAMAQQWGSAHKATALRPNSDDAQRF